jgi:hypothetical protein
VSSAKAQVTAAGGIGDFLRGTPLVRVFAASGYAVDTLLARDYLNTADLLEEAREIPPLPRHAERMDDQPPRMQSGIQVCNCVAAASALCGGSLAGLRVWVKEKR